MHDPDVAGPSSSATAPVPAKARSAAATTAAPTLPPDQLRPYQDVLTFPPVHDLRGEGPEACRTVTIRTARVNHAPTQLGATTAWTYDGSLPGPTFVVERGQTARIHWQNAIPADQTLPFRVVKFPDRTPPEDPNKPPDPFPQVSPGAAGGTLDAAAAALTASTVTHLHGSRAQPDSDGWTENVAVHGQTQHTTYPDRQRAATLWYHDHALGVTRFNVYAGLSGFWLVRDPAEDALVAAGTLPGGKDELCLLIQDRNLDADDATGGLTGAILHKTEASTAELFGPYTMVNGVIWPRCTVGAGPLRLRLLNGSNARTYALRLVVAERVTGPGGEPTVRYGEDVTHSVPIWQVGTDGGLLDFPVNLPFTAAAPAPAPATPPDASTLQDRGLILASAERADLVIDFSGREGQTLALVNTAFAPYHGSTVTFPYLYDTSGVLTQEQDGAGNPVPIRPAGTADPAFRLPFSHVLLFDIQPAAPELPGGASPSPLAATTPLAKDFRRFVHRATPHPARRELVLPAHGHRWIALTEFPAGSLFFRELVAVTTDRATADATGLPLIAIQARDGTTTWYRTAAMAFHDAIQILIARDSWEVWNLLNLTGDTHPIHLHLVEFQALHRQPYDKAGYVDGGGYTLPDLPIRALADPYDPDPNEQAYKDTIRVNPGEVVSIAAQFGPFCGRYMYHCHIIEHEDMDMMRPFIVLPPDSLAMMKAGGMGGMSM